mmetsp:Transcript_2026/g.5196  ORF Transcript_2026/g.5196 Transcript_2026/m.5196 type:complete len:229 (+) Transcript_2026:350-1036(+)
MHQPLGVRKAAAVASGDVRQPVQLGAGVAQARGRQLALLDAHRVQEQLGEVLVRDGERAVARGQRGGDFDQGDPRARLVLVRDGKVLLALRQLELLVFVNARGARAAVHGLFFCRGAAIPKFLDRLLPAELRDRVQALLDRAVERPQVLRGQARASRRAIHLLPRAVGDGLAALLHAALPPERLRAPVVHAVAELAPRQPALAQHLGGAEFVVARLGAEFMQAGGVVR